MTTVDCPGKCPTCGFEFQKATLVSGKPDLASGTASGVCSACAEVLHVTPALTMRVLTAREFVTLNIQNQINAALMVHSVLSRIAGEKAKAN